MRISSDTDEVGSSSALKRWLTEYYVFYSFYIVAITYMLVMNKKYIIQNLYY